MAKRKFDPLHPGVVPAEDNKTIQGKRGMTAGTALRLGKFLGVEARFWMNLQCRSLPVGVDGRAQCGRRELTPHCGFA